MEIPISLETYKALTLLLTDERDSYDAVICRLLPSGKPASEREEGVSPPSEMADWLGYGVMLPVGTKLRRRFKKVEHVGTVQKDGLHLNNKVYTSLSGAGTSITSYNLNGWYFWEYCNPETNQWELAVELRNKK